MSELNDFDNNTVPEITATEEAFDQFQAHSAGEEGDFILLSDIVPAENTVETLEVPGSYDDGLIDGTEVSSLEYLYEPQVEAAAGYDAGEAVTLNDLSERLTLGNPDHDYDVQPEEIQPEIPNSILTEQVLPRKRGRKPKKRYDNSQDISTTLNQTVPQTTTRGRRGRRPKNSQPVVSHQDLDKKTNGTALSLDISEPPKKVLCRNARSSVLSKQIEEEKIDSAIPVPKRRGRKKKINPEDNLKSEPLQSYEESTENVMEIVNPAPKKRGRKKKIKEESSELLKNEEESTLDISMGQDDDDADDICLSKLKKDISTTDETESITNMVKNQDIMATGNTLLDDFEYNIDHVKPETPNVVVESVADIHTNFKLNIESVTSVSIDNKPSLLESSEPTDKASDVAEPSVEPAVDNNALLVEDSTKRPQRRNARKTMHYEVDSDADPFADISSTDDEDCFGAKKRKKNRRKSDDEFIPGDGKESSDESVQEDWDEDLDRLLTMSRKKPGRGRGRPPKEYFTPQKSVQPSMKPVGSDDIEACLEPTVITGSNSDSSNTLPKPDFKNNTLQLAAKEFQNFLNRRMQGSEGLKIQKVSMKETSTTTVVPLEIPSIDPNETKSVDISTQTSMKETKTALVQTSSPYSIKMTNTLELSSQQTDNACVFLKGILKTTSELGTLMTEKSEEFIQKKVNADYVKDTMKVDYCIKKAFLLFKLAKDNLTTMEENLEKQYEEFLKANDLSKSIETEKKVAPKPPENNSDSDCEIVGETIAAKPAPKFNQKGKPKFNPKTVFLNKELSIKIAKKPTENADAFASTAKKAMSMKGTHSVWINDAVMVKKVKGQQSFLAQDSRNKKPPDYTPKKITEKMVKSFFEERYRAQAMRICRLYTSPQWNEVSTAVTCNYFFINKEDESCSSHAVSQPLEMDSTTENAMPKLDFVDSTSLKAIAVPNIPQTLLSMCTEVLRKSMYPKNSRSLRASISEDNTNHCNETAESKGTLFDLCIKSICSNRQFHCDQVQTSALPKLECLKTLCYKKVIDLMSANNVYKCTTLQEDENSVDANSQLDWAFLLDGGTSCLAETASETSSQYSSTIKQYQRDIFDSMTKHKNGICKPTFPAKTPDTLKKITYDNIKLLLFGDLVYQEAELSDLDEAYNVPQLSKLCFEVISKYFAIESHNSGIPVNALTIRTVNTLSDEAFWNMEETSNDSQYAEDEAFCNDYEDPVTREDDSTEPDNWESRVQMQELKSGIINSLLEHPQEYPQEESAEQPAEEPAHVQIKQEALDDHAESVEPINIKREPEDHHSGMVNIPSELANIVAKGELQDYTDNVMPPLTDGAAASNVPAEAFEDFVRRNKMMRAISYEDGEDEHSIFSQSGLRVRRQFEPDSYNNYEIDMDLLVPQQAEPLTEIVAKDTLMESSSDDDNVKQKSDKKQDKRKRGRPKKNSNLSTPVKNIVEKLAPVEKPEKQIEKPGPVSKKVEKLKPAPVLNNEIAVMTRRMRERIRNEEKRDSSNSDTEELTSLPDKIISKKKSTRNKKLTEEEIQCSNVDSTEQISENFGIERPPSDDREDSFSGFSPVDQNDVNRYQKYLNDVYEKILPRNTKEGESEELQSGVCSPSNRSSPLLVGNEPVELLECEPTMPIFDPPKPRAKKAKKIDKPEDTNYIDRHGWKCYPMDGKDTKLYKSVPYVGLDKLPEVFVETYFQYLNVTGKSKEDAEVDRLTNLQSLHKPQTSLSQTSKSKGRSKDKADGQQSGQTTDVESARASPDHSDYNELAPSDDEGAKVEDEIPPPAPKQTADNCLAKNLLMNDNESDTEATETASETSTRIKTEPVDEASKPAAIKPKMRGKSATVKVFATPEALVLTADKMMKTELAMLHAPIVPDDEIKDYEPKESKYSPSKDPSSKPKEKHLPKRSSRRERVNPDDSSSEEEKQWVSTKEKLLKRMEKRVQEDTSFADAKRAKIVNEFIEKQASKPAQAPPVKQTRRGRRSKKKFLERQKQLKVLSNELYGDAAAYTGKKGSTGAAAYAKGRRNIRKVIDKKSLARSTVMANMEEFERKRRLNMKQNRLKELLGYEEGVNVLVINDEVCLEYDFEDLQPVVSVHPFFTKVMKAHQYEGVKFMWDACFESLEMVESGSGGGGCILAHCMGLGKTLQVLALLHTVLTHPRVRMQRVLVCCPLSTVLNWVDEIHKWLGPVTDQIKVFELSKLKKTYERAYQLEDWYNGGGIFIIGYELFRSLSTLDPALDDVRPTIIKKIRSALLDPGPDIIVCDEGHLLKNDSSVLAIAMSRVKTRRRIILTGTPMQNNLREYYCMVDFVKPNLLGTYFEYSNRFENPIMNGQHRDSREEDIKLMKARTHILHRVLEGCLQRQEASVLYPYLPKKHEYTVFISLSKCQSDLYRHYLSGYKSRAVISKQSSLLKDYNILQKIWSHPRVLHNFQTRQRDAQAIKAERLAAEDDLARADLTADVDVKPSTADVKPEMEVWWLDHMDGGNALESLESSNKFVTVFKILKECVELGDKLLIFSTSLFTMDALEYFLQMINGWSLGQEYYRLDGSVPPEVRQKWCREFNAEHNVKTKLFLISTRAGCLGLNMTAANRVIILDTSWNPAHDIQSIFRVYRFGQKKDCYIYRLVAMGTMEQKIYERSVTKQAVACRVVDEQQIDRHYNIGELADLYRLDEAGEGVSCGVAVGVRDVVLLRVARDTRALHAVHEHDSLLRDTREELPEDERAAAWHQFQQEQQMQDRLNMINMPPTMTTPKVPAKRTYGQEVPANTVAQPTTSAAPTYGEIRPAVKLEERTETTYTPGPRNKKGRKGMISCDIPVRKPTANPPAEAPKSSSPITILPDSSDPQSQTIIAKITAALQKHNFKFSDGSLRPAALAKMVSSIISNVNVEVTPTNTDIASSLVNALTATSQQVDEVDEDTPLADRITRRGRSKKKQAAPPKENTVAPTPETVEDVVSPRTKRQAAITAELKIETGKESPSTVINLDEDSDAEYFPDDDYHHYSDPEPDKQEPLKPIPVSTLRAGPKPTTSQVSDSSKPLTPKAKAQLSDGSKLVTYKAKAKTSQVSDSSILLSDDETPSDPNADGVIPLHTSLLSNKNFIKIVAHTYLKGNPMMDEDAATLAAEYSTSKALKEVQSTGKSIDCGPIYDIAKKVLGMDVLRKLHNADAKKSTASKSSESAPQKPAAGPAQKTMKITPKPLSTMTAPAEDTKIKVTPLPKMVKLIDNKPTKKLVPKIMIKNSSLLKPMEVVNALKQEIVDVDSNVAVSMSGSANPALVYPGAPTMSRNTAGVVPVGLVKRGESTALADSFALNQEESILPDDDEVHFVNEPKAPASAPPLPTSLIPSNLLDMLAKKRKQTLRPKSERSIVTLPATTDTTGRVISLQKVKQVPVNAKIIKLQRNMLPSLSAPAPAAPPPQQQPAAGSTICLDSDEEDAPTIVSGPIPSIVSGPIPAGQPTPVSLHTSLPNNPHARTLLLPQSLSTAQQQMYQQQMVQQQIAQQIGQQQLAQQQMGQQQRAQQPQLVQLNMQGQQSFTLNHDQLGQLQTMFGSNKNFVLVPASALQGGQVPVAMAAGGPVPVAITAGGAMPQTVAYPQASEPAANKTVETTEAPAQPENATKKGGKVGIPKLKPSPASAKPAAAAPAKAAKTKNKAATLPTPPVNAPAKPTPPKEPPPPPPPQKSKPFRVVSSSSSSESERSRSPSPDPMSLFKNVVHIQAPSCSDAAAPAAPPAEPPQSPKKTRAGPKSKTLAPTNPAPSKTNAKPSKPDLPEKSKSRLPSATAASKAKTSQPLRLLASFDLTESKKPEKPKAKPNMFSKPAKNLNASPNKPATISGTSKNIIIGGANKSLSKAGPVKKTTEAASSSQSSGRVVHITNMKTLAPPTTKPPQDAKRKAPAAAPAPEAKKAKKPTRLEDFSLDDIEDIIELE